MTRVGVPRALHYFRHFPAIKAFFETLGLEVVTSPPTNREIVSLGLECTVAETCLPVKVFAGHCAYLQGKVDYIFVPSIKSLEPKLYNCIKLFTLPDVMRAIVPGRTPLLEFCLDINLGKSELEKQVYEMGRIVGADRRLIRAASEAALQAQKQHTAFLATDPPLRDILGKLEAGPSAPATIESERDHSPTIALVSHPYTLYDDYVNHGVARKLTERGIRVVTAEGAGSAELERGVNAVIGDSYWLGEHDITGAAGHFMFNRDVDGVVVVTSFGCGPDSVMLDAIQRASKRTTSNPLLSLVIDEHTADAGLVTRLEAFADTVTRSQGQRLLPASMPIARTPRTGHIRNAIRATVPHMGTVHVPLQVLFRKIGVDFVVPPPSSRRSLELASRYSPESACIPYKLTLGNFIEAMEMGANTAFILTGPNNCRFGYYARLQDQVLNDLGFQFQWGLPEIEGRTIKGIVGFLQEISGKSWLEALSAVRLCLATLSRMDELERKVQRVRALELASGTTTAIWKRALADLANVDDMRSLRNVFRAYSGELDAVPTASGIDPLKICLVGEIYVVQEPYINQDIEIELGRLGVEVSRSEQVSEWLGINYKILLEAIGLGHAAKIKRAEKPYMRYYSGETIGQAVLAQKDGYDGVIQLAPFTCTPEVVAQNLLPRVRKDVDIPVLTLVMDEQTGQAGFRTRLEAFVDLMERRRSAGRRLGKAQDQAAIGL